MSLVTQIGGNANGLVNAVEKSKRSLQGLNSYSAITGKNFKKMSGQINSAVSSLQELGSAAIRGDIDGLTNSISGLALNTKGFTSILGKASPAVANFTKNVGGLLGKIGLVAGLLGLLGKGIADAVKKAKELREQRFNEEWDKQNVSLSKYSEKIAEHVLDLETLKSKVHDNTLALKERKKAISDIQAIVPEYTASISREGKVTKENTAALDKYINKLFTYYKTLAWKDKFIEMYKKGIDAQLELEKKREKLAKTEESVEQNNRNYDNSYFAAGPGAIAPSWMGSGQDQSIHMTNAALDNAQKEVKEAEKKVEENEKDLKKIKDNYKKSVKENGDFTIDNGPNKSNTKGGGGKTTPIEIHTQALDIKPIDNPFDYKLLKSYDMDEFVHESITRLEIKLKYWQQKVKDATTDAARQAANDQVTAIQNAIKSVNDRLSGQKIDIVLPKLFEETNKELTPHQKKMQALAGTYDMIGNGLADLGSAMNSFANEEMKAVATMLSATSQLFAVIGQVIAAGGAQGLAKDLAKGWPANIAAIATTIGLISTVIATIGSVSGMKFATGGIVGGGSYTGDHIPIQVNSGEMILNRTQQSRLFNMLNGGPTASANNIAGEVKFEIQGTKLIGVLSNTQRKIANI